MKTETVVSVGPLAPSFVLLSNYAQAAMQGLLASPGATGPIGNTAWILAQELMDAMPRGMKTRLRAADEAWATATGGQA